MTFLFDGDCAFCTSAAIRLKQIVGDKIDVQPYQLVDLASLSISSDDCAKAVKYLRGDQLYSGSQAIAKALVDAKNLWSIAGLFMQIPVISSVAYLIYEWVSKNRHKLPGGTPACVNPTER